MVKTNGSLVLTDSQIDIKSPKALAEFAKTLKTFIVEKELYVPIQEKNYVLVEGWQFAGVSMGILPVVSTVTNIPTEGEAKFKQKQKKGGYVEIINPIFKYEAVVELINFSTGDVVGRGVAICTNQEYKKRTFDEFAIASMAQTRATGKAYRLLLSWIMKMADFETTPYEEAEDVIDDTPEEDVITEIPIEDIRTLVDLKLQSMDAASKVKYIKDWTGSVNVKNITDDQYRRMYENLPRKVGNE